MLLRFYANKRDHHACMNNQAEQYDKNFMAAREHGIHNGDVLAPKTVDQ